MGALLLALAARPAMAGSGATTWFPLAQGNQWTLHDYNTGNEATIACDQTSGTYFHLTGLNFNWVEYEGGLSTSLYEWNEDTDTLAPFLRPGASAPWSFSVAGGSAYGASWNAAGAAIGSFNGCASVDFTRTAGARTPGDMVHLWLAPGVGPVRIVTSDGETWDLSTATVGGQVIQGGPPNQPPAIAPISDISVVEGTPISFFVSAQDPDGDPLTFAVSGLPSGATYNRPPQMFSWTPAAGQAGTYKVSFSVSDGKAQVSTTVTINVAAKAVALPAWRRDLPAGSFSLSAVWGWTAQVQAKRTFTLSGTRDGAVTLNVINHWDGYGRNPENLGTVMVGDDGSFYLEFQHSWVTEHWFVQGHIQAGCSIYVDHWRYEMSESVIDGPWSSALTAASGTTSSSGSATASSSSSSSSSSDQGGPVSSDHAMYDGRGTVLDQQTYDTYYDPSAGDRRWGDGYYTGSAGGLGGGY